MTAPSPRLIYLPHIDGLRAVAVIAVVIYHLHAAWLPGGFAGVDVFFVISGFIVSASVGSLQQSNLLKFMAFFYARRLQRIAPALVACLLLTFLASAIFIPSAWLSEANQRTGLYAFFGLSNFVLAKFNNDYFSPVSDFNPYTHTWSLGVEEQFYFVFPLFFLAWTCSRKWRGLTVGLFAAALLASLAYSSYLGQTNKTLAFYMLSSRFWELAAGVLLYQGMRLSGLPFDGRVRRFPAWTRWIAVISLALIAYAFVNAQPAGFSFPGAVPVVLGTIGMLWAMHGQGPGHPLMAALTARPVVFVGKISYSLYLWHWPIFVLFRWTVGLDSTSCRVLAVLLAFGFAIVSYFLIENPVRHLSVLRHKPRYVVVSLGIAMIALATVVSKQIENNKSTISISEVTKHANDWYPDRFDLGATSRECVIHAERTSLGADFELSYTRSNCATPVKAPKVYVIGDSHAMAYEAMLKGYVLATGSSVTIYNNGGCPFLSMHPWREDSEKCRTSAKLAVDDLLKKLAPGDVVFLPSLRFQRFVDQWFRLPEYQARDALFSDWAVKQRAEAEEPAAGILKQFSAKGAHVVLEAPKPIFRSPTYRCIETYNQSNDICRDGLGIDRQELEGMRKPILDSFAHLIAAVPGVTIWDPLPVLCPSSKPKCSALMKGRPLFFDGDHLSGYGNRVLLSSFQAFMISTMDNSISDVSDRQ
jgi:peptidoglycan/LPS O-acetylase OafA/YrhL